MYSSKFRSVSITLWQLNIASENGPLTSLIYQQMAIFSVRKVLVEQRVPQIHFLIIVFLIV